MLLDSICSPDTVQLRSNGGALHGRDVEGVKNFIHSVNWGRSEVRNCELCRAWSNDLSRREGATVSEAL